MRGRIPLRSRRMGVKGGGGERNREGGRKIVVAQFSSVQFSPLTDWVVGGDMRDDSAEILFQSFLQEALENSSGTDRDVHSLMLNIQHFLCRPRHRPPSKVP